MGKYYVLGVVTTSSSQCLQLELLTMKCVTLFLLLLYISMCSSAKGGLRAGVLNTRTGRRRNNGLRNYETDWSGGDSGFGLAQKRNNGGLRCDEICQYNRLMGLSEEVEEPEVLTTSKPCVGLCHLQKKNNLPEDKNLTQIKEARQKGQRCVGLCYIRRKQGKGADPDLEKLQKNRPCVGLCFLVKKKQEELAKLEEEGL